MQKLKWKYYKNIDEWQTVSGDKDDDPFCITKINDAFFLYQNFKSFSNFAKLSSAKKVAQLIAFG